MPPTLPLHPHPHPPTLTPPQRFSTLLASMPTVAMLPPAPIPTLTLLTSLCKVVGWLEMARDRATSWFSREQL